MQEEKVTSKKAKGRRQKDKCFFILEFNECEVSKNNELRKPTKNCSKLNNSYVKLCVFHSKARNFRTLATHTKFCKKNSRF